MQPGDVITAVDGVQVDEQNTLQALISKHKPGDTVELGLSTAGKDRTLRVQLAARSENSEAAFLGVTYVQTSEMPTPEMKVH
jgi:S1-C subfamily serine protease